MTTAAADVGTKNTGKALHGDDLQQPIEEWGKLIGDVPSASAILDRFFHHAEIIQTYRQKLPNGLAAERTDDPASKMAFTDSK